VSPDPSPALDVATAVRVLTDGELEPVGRLLDASNATLYCAASLGDLEVACVYKPVQGERPLWDFPGGTLAAREVAAYEVSEAGGWHLVPPTVLRDGPFGEGMVQLWVEVDESIDVGALVRSDAPALRAMALLDAVINNADRKGGHLLPVDEQTLYGCDHGVCFHVEPKLRTLLWRWRGQPLSSDEVAQLSELRALLAGELGARLAELLAPAEVAATSARVDALLTAGVFPFPDPEWPAIPWPPW
jgi:hypothetical protein